MSTIYCALIWTGKNWKTIYRLGIGKFYVKIHVKIRTAKLIYTLFYPVLEWDYPKHRAAAALSHQRVRRVLRGRGGVVVH